MPHLFIECSPTVPREAISRELLRELNQALTDTGVVRLSDIKTRVLFCSEFLVGNGGEFDSFVHSRLALLPGRTPEKKQELTRALFQVLSDRLALALRESGRKCALSIELVELVEESYVKGIVG